MAHIPHVYVPGPWPDGDLVLPEPALHHLETVLRRSPGSTVTYTDGEGRMGEGRLEGAHVRRGAERLVERPFPPITLAVAPPRSADRQRMIVEKLAELGVDRLVWLRSRHGEGRPPRPDKAAAWAAGALEQSRGAHRLEVSSQQLPPLDLNPLLFVADQQGEPFPPFTGAVTLVVGPEGGLAPDEIPDGAVRVSLGDRVLRVETAAIAGATLLTALRARGDLF